MAIRRIQDFMMSEHSCYLVRILELALQTVGSFSAKLLPVILNSMDTGSFLDHFVKSKINHVISNLAQKSNQHIQAIAALQSSCRAETTSIA
jgi:hypothetical protein